MSSFTEMHDHLRGEALHSIGTHITSGKTHVEGIGGVFPHRTELVREGAHIKFNGMPSSILDTKIIVRAADLLNGVLS